MEYTTKLHNSNSEKEAKVFRQSENTFKSKTTKSVIYKPISSSVKTRIAFISTVIVLLIVFIVESLFRQSLFDYSIKAIKKIHANYNSKDMPIYIAAKFFSVLPKEITFAIVIVLVYFLSNLLKQVIVLMNILISMLIICLLKIIYQSPRPFWKSDEIMKIDCEEDFGNPSGHSFTAVFMFITYYLVGVYYNKWFYSTQEIEEEAYFAKNKKYLEKSENSISKTNYYKILRIVLLILMILVTFLVCASRFILGVHSLNQIIFGATLGLITAYIIFGIVFTDLNDYSILLQMISHKYFFLVNVAFFIIVTVATFFILFFMEDYNYAKQFTGIVNMICPNVVSYQDFYNKSIKGIIVSLTYLGSVMGLYFDYYYNCNGNSILWIEKSFGYSHETLVNNQNKLIMQNMMILEDEESPSSKNYGSIEVKKQLLINDKQQNNRS